MNILQYLLLSVLQNRRVSIYEIFSDLEFIYI